VSLLCSGQGRRPEIVLRYSRQVTGFSKGATRTMASIEACLRPRAHSGWANFGGSGQILDQGSQKTRRWRKRDSNRPSRSLKTSWYNLGARGRRVQFHLFFAASHPANAAQFLASAGLQTSSTASMHPVIAAAHVCQIIVAPTLCKLSVEPHVLHSQSVIDAVDHRGVAFDIGVPAGAGTIVPEDRPGRLFRQLTLDPPYQLLAFDRVELH
jgi:hypothetical protein